MAAQTYVNLESQNFVKFTDKMSFHQYCNLFLLPWLFELVEICALYIYYSTLQYHVFSASQKLPRKRIPVEHKSRGLLIIKLSTHATNSVADTINVFWY